MKLGNSVEFPKNNVTFSVETGRPVVLFYDTSFSKLTLYETRYFASAATKSFTTNSLSSIALACLSSLFSQMARVFLCIAVCFVRTSSNVLISEFLKSTTHGLSQ